MRKVTSILIMLVSVLTMWGQNTNSVLTMWGQNTKFTYEAASEAITWLKDAQAEIIQQANDSQIGSTDKENAKGLLNETFQKLDKVMSVYKQIESDPQLNHEAQQTELTQEAQQIISEFIYKFQIAILDDNKTKINVSTRRFMDVAEDSSKKFDEFYSEAQKFIESHPSASEVKTDGSEAQNTGNINSEELESQDNGTSPETLKNGSASSLIAWIAFGIGILSLLLSVLALIKINNEHRRISKCEHELEGAERRINQKINEIKPSSFRGATSSDAPTQQYVPQPKPQPRKAQTPVKPVYREGKAQGEKVVERPTISYLYATIKAQSPYAEFFKVASENSGDKVFMLTLANPEADVAEFTIAPNMTPDFMKSVIVDRDTYLPSLFCEKFIDSSNPTRIEVDSVGRAKKVDEKWQVQERMKIRLV